MSHDELDTSDAWKAGHAVLLNDGAYHEDASAGCSFTLRKWKEGEEEPPHIHGTFRVRDCSQTVHIQLDVGDVHAYMNSRRKLQKLMAEVQNALIRLDTARDKYITERNRYDARQKKEDRS